MTDNIDPKLQEDLTVPVKQKSYKKKKSYAIYTILIILLLGVMGYSGYQVVSTLVRDSTAKNTYDNIVSEFVSVVPAKPEETRPAQINTPETEESGGEKATHEGIDPATHTVLPTRPQKASEEETEAPEVGLSRLSVDFDRLKSVNRDVVGWLQGQGDSVNYPVVQGKDNDYYLSHLIDGSYNGNGTLFVYDQNSFLQDSVTYIFGHHMQNGAMFGSLGKYDQIAYLRANPEFRLYTPDKTYTLLVWTVFYGDGMEKVVMNYSSEASFDQAMAAYAYRSLYPTGVEVSYGDKLVCLCTCAYHISDGRYFIFCKVVDDEG